MDAWLERWSFAILTAVVVGGFVAHALRTAL